MRRFWETTPIIRSVYWLLLGRHRSNKARQRWASLSPADVFIDIYKANRWHDSESRSGTGSNLEQTETIRRELPALFRRYNVRTLLDIPCGDFAWMSQIDLAQVDYLGGDIVPDLIAQNTAKYGSPHVAFKVCDIITDRLPPADMLLVRDCFVHLSFSDARRAIVNVMQSHVRYLLSTTFPEVTRNRDIVTGEWRAINLNLAPYGFPPARELVDEKCTEPGRYARSKMLGLWDVEELRKQLPSVLR